MTLHLYELTCHLKLTFSVYGLVRHGPSSRSHLGIYHPTNKRHAPATLSGLLRSSYLGTIVNVLESPGRGTWGLCTVPLDDTIQSA